MKAIFLKMITIAFAILLSLTTSNQLFSNNLYNPNIFSVDEFFVNLPPCPDGEVEVIFSLDMTCADTDLRPPVVTGPFNGFSGDGNIMVDPDGDDIWEAIICAVPGSTFEYKYAILNFADQENLVDDAIGGATCSYNTNFFDFSNRLVTIPAGGGTLPVDTYGICGTCDNPPINVTFNINMNCSDVPPGTPVAMFGLFNGFCCPYGLEDPDGDNMWTTTLPFPPDGNGCITMEYLYMSPDFSNVESFLTNGEDLANCPNINTDFASFANRLIMVCADTVLDDYWNTCFAPEEPVGGCDDNICDNGFETWDGCECITTTAVLGCTDSTANNYDPNANCDDNSCTFDLCDDPCAPNFEGTAPCLPYDMTCNNDCTLGPFGGIWDVTTCSCINETTPVIGCMDATYCEFNPTANCDDNSCIILNTDPGTCNDQDCSNGFEIWDSQNCICITDPTVLTVFGCTDDLACNYNPNANCDDNSCDFGNASCIDPCIEVLGCTDNNACNFNPDACVADNSCDFGNTACTDPCNPVMGCTDPLNCNYDPTACVEDGSCNPAAGCTDDTACNFDIDACVDDGSCDYGNIACTDPCNVPNPDDGCDLTTDSFDAATCTVTNIANCAAGESFNTVNCECVIDVVDGCTDPCDPAYNPASTNDVLCAGYSTDCNTDCTAGPFGGTWDTITCTCINEITPVSGCMSVAACNYNAAANCDDGTCDFGNSACADPCNEPNPDDGCDLTTDSFDAANCTVINTANCAAGETFNPTNCECIIDIVDGCTDPCDPGYNPVSTNNNLCVGYSTDCNTDCTVGAFGGIWDSLTCGCINETTPVLGCTDSNATNFNPAANCDDNSCIDLPCEDEISGTINTEMTCDVSGTAVLITDTTGNPIGMAIADASGNYTLPGGPYACGEYIATLDVASIPACYADSGGDVGPAGFVVDGDGNADGANFSSFDEVPTLSQWGLISLALLLMILGALKLSSSSITASLSSKK